jgi:hypothetical protein
MKWVFLPSLLLSAAAAAPLSSIRADAVCVVPILTYAGNAHYVTEVPPQVTALLAQSGIDVKRKDCDNTLFLETEILNLYSGWGARATVQLSETGGDERLWKKGRLGYSPTPVSSDFLNIQVDLAILDAVTFFLVDWKDTH